MAPTRIRIREVLLFHEPEVRSRRGDEVKVALDTESASSRRRLHLLTPIRAKKRSRRYQALFRCLRESFSVVILAAALAFGGVLVAGQPEEPNAPALPKARPLKIVLGLERLGDADILILGNGEKLTGTLVNDTFSLRTSYAQLKFDRRLVAGMDLDSDSRRLDSIITVNNSRFSGFLDDTALIIKDANSSTQLRREKVRTAIFRANPTELQEIPQRHFIQLRNGDFFTGRILPDQFQLTTARGMVQFRLAELESLSFVSGKSPAAKITKRSGEMLQGSLGTEEVEIQLDVGGTIRVYLDRIEVIYCREGFVPASLGLAVVPRSGEQDSSSRIQANPEGKSMEGMVWIPPGEFTMGSPNQEADRDFDEGPPTRVTIPHGFWMGKYEVTQAEYQSVMAANPSQSTGNPKCPVEKVSWYEALKYCVQLTQREQAAGKLPANYAYRLPTEAEWEYACRAGTTTRFSYGDDLASLSLDDYAWFTGNASSTTHPVGTKRPNPWGLYDMHGNVLEWCLDNWTGSLPGGKVTNVPASATGTLRVARGGSWLYEAKFARSANRDDYSPSNRCSDLGFRIVLAPISP